MQKFWAAKLISYLVVLSFVGPLVGEELLYNGIELPEAWPPKRESLTREPIAVPYLENRPAVVPIDLGRQLFVDDFLIHETTLHRTFHSAEYHPANPILTADRDWESARGTYFAAPYSDGVWFDANDDKFKLWYLAGNSNKTCYAESKDGIHWKKPTLDVVADTNVVHEVSRDSGTIWLDHAAKDSSARYKYFTTESGKGWQLTYRKSKDGIHWSKPLAASSLRGDRTTVFYNPFRKVWCLSERLNGGKIGRARAYMEDPDPLELIKKTSGNGRLAEKAGSVLWLCSDRQDPRHPDPRWRDIEPQLYNFDAVAYESIMLGLFTIWQGPENDVSKKLGNHKRNDLLLGFSRDGFHFSRPDRRPFIGCQQLDGAWNWGNVQSSGGGCLVVGDRLYFYVSGRALDSTGLQGRMSTGLATLRRDGFASMNAHDRPGQLTTRPITFNRRFLFVNVDCPGGELKVEVLDPQGKVIAPFTLKNCRGISGDSTSAMVEWTDGDLRSVTGQAVKLRFHLTKGSLYSFWTSNAESGASGGYVAAGGPGFTSNVDTVGQTCESRSPTD